MTTCPKCRETFNDQPGLARHFAKHSDCNAAAELLLSFARVGIRVCSVCGVAMVRDMAWCSKGWAHKDCAAKQGDAMDK